MILSDLNKIQITLAEEDIERKAEEVVDVAVDEVADQGLVSSGIKAKITLSSVKVAARTLFLLRKSWRTDISISNM